ncbi:DUF6283 family protein [Streptomyces sp. NPDC018055]|uniref:DUF6283 family protein n=1 Tax=Streptomyces sp. NPDC018055 TaxID=3365038 RepID=UPI003788AA8C
MTTLPPAPRPCATCPYREDVPSGVWDESEYAKLPPFDGPTYAQPGQVFLCHQHDRDSDRARVCSGWAGCHDMGESLALRIAVASGTMTPEDAETTADYVSPVPLFTSGAKAAAHGMAEVLYPGEDAAAAISKIARTRTDLT